MNTREQQQAARAFATKWQGRGYEKGDTAPFWLELLRECLGVTDPDTIARFEQRTDAGFPDVTIADTGVIIEQKSIGIDLDKAELRQDRPVTPYQQALSYAQSLPPSLTPRYIITCNFQTFRIYDREIDQSGKTYTQFELAELDKQIHLLNFIVDPALSRIERDKAVSMNAGRLIGELHTELLGAYIDPESDFSQHSLNVLCVRLVFLLYAEDSGLFGKKHILFDYLQAFDAGQMRDALLALFDVLNTPENQRDPYLTPALAAFPYVDGGLFAARIEIPNFTDDTRFLLLFKLSQQTDWSAISPTIFGAVFESTLNPETRQRGAMHYTSVENIHKVINPLFLDQLEDEYEGIITGGFSERTTIAMLRSFQEKLASLNFIDPACGSGNFLTETYICLRRLENRLLMRLQGNQSALGFEGLVAKVSISQFHGIEINDFAVSVATTALWIAEMQANMESEGVIQHSIESLPLTDSANIVLGNALNIDWNDVLPAAQCSYVMGNPPFIGARNQSNEQKAELMRLFTDAKNAGDIDYVAGWYIKAADYMTADCRAAFVSTNSITQGVQVANVWSPLFDRGIAIDFAHRTFRWTQKGTTTAHVFVVIIGFSLGGAGERLLFDYATPDSLPQLSHPNHINAYLQDAPNIFIYSRKAPICDVPKMGIGNKPIDGGHYLFTDEEKNEFLAKEPGAARFFHGWLGSDEFINGRQRWVLWLGEASRADLQNLPLCRARVEAVKTFRLESKSAPTRKLAERPTRFHVENMPEGTSVLVPEVSSERRFYIPIGFIEPETFCSNLVRLIPNATLYHFGVLTSQVHNAWMRVVTGRLEARYRYSAELVYNNFPWPETDEVQREQISNLAQAVLDARALYPELTLADLYDPDYMPDPLRQAHKALDRAVEQAYSLRSSGDEQQIVSHLFELHAQMIGGG